MKTIKKSATVNCPNCKKKENIKLIFKDKFSVYFCKTCLNGFTHPVPLRMEKYYKNTYWKSKGIVGKLKDFIFSFFQKRRKTWIKNSFSKGRILDFGAGEGEFSKYFSNEYKVDSLEQENARITNKAVIKKNFLSFKVDYKYNSICFWESLEHVVSPQAYLQKANSLLDKNGKIFIEFPRFNSFESKLFGKNWFHLDIPRHVSHLTDKGIVTLLKRVGFKNVRVENVFSLEYAPWGFTASLLNYIKKDTTDYLKKSGNVLFFILILPIILFSIIIEALLFLISESPIGLAVAEKNE